VLQIDAHMRFRENWDVHLIHELTLCPTPERSVLSTYPVGYHLPNAIPNETRGTRLHAWKFDDSHILRQTARFHELPPDKPVLTSMFAAGFCFGPSDWMIRACPYDGRLHHLFFGEELSMSLRLYTHGYDMYAPRESVCYHLWSRTHRPAGNPIDAEIRQKSLAIVAEQCKGKVDHSCYGLGTQRSVSQWETQVGVNLQECLIQESSQENDDFMIGEAS
jgi:[Skp1-protein]-hydroxyproline N-acetylglucosaminyltransferase